MDRLKMHSEWFDSVLKRVGFYNPECPYPKNDLGMTVFLEKQGIRIIYEFVPDMGWRYHSIDKIERDCFTEDMEVYPDFDKCAQIAIMESMCYLLNKNS